MEYPTILHGAAEHALPTLEADSVHAVVTDPPYGLNIGRIAGQAWDTDDTVAFDRELWAEALRVVKPGGLIIAFGASRTWHRLATAIEDAGAVIEDTILAWSRADKKLVDTDIAREFRKRGDHANAARFADCHTMFKPAHEPIIVARKPYAEGLTRLENIRVHGVGFLNFSDAYTPTSEDLSRTPGAPRKDGVMNYQRGGMDPSVPHAGGRYPHNQVFVHEPDCIVDGECAPWCSAAAFDHEHPGKTRYFRSFYHSGRTSVAERTAGGDHLTVKPVALMEWLVGIATLPGQRVLDMFAGSGTTLVAASRTGREATVIEREEEFVEVIRERAAAEQRERTLV